MKEAHGDPRAYAASGLEGGDIAFDSPRSSSSPRRTPAGRTRRAFALYNERLLLSLVRRFGPLSKIEVARLTGLSVQSTSAIMNRLQAEGLLKREAPLRGRVGQPTIPMSIDPEGAYSFGLKDRAAQLRSGADRFPRRHSSARLPRLRFSDTDHDPRFCPELTAVALQFAHAGAEAADRRPWRRGAVPVVELGSGDRRAAGRNERLARFRRRRAKLPPCALIRLRCAMMRPPLARPSSSSARVAASRFPLFFHRRVPWRRAGARRRAVARAHRQRRRAWVDADHGEEQWRRAPQLIACASIYQLERRLERGRRSTPRRCGRLRTPGSEFGTQLEGWIEEVASALAYAVGRGDFRHRFRGDRDRRRDAATVRDRLTARTAQIFAGLDRRGFSEVVIVSGTIGADARAIGGAALPLIKNFARDREVLFKDAMSP